MLHFLVGHVAQRYFAQLHDIGVRKSKLAYPQSKTLALARRLEQKLSASSANIGSSILFVSNRLCGEHIRNHLTQRHRISTIIQFHHHQIATIHAA